MAQKIFQFDDQDYDNALAYWKAEKTTLGEQNHSMARLCGTIGEMACVWYMESYYPLSGVLPYGLMTRAGVCNTNGFNAGDVVVVLKNHAMRFEVKSTGTPDNLWRIKETDAAQYSRNGIDQVIFVSVNDLGRLPEAEIYGRVTPGEILCFWEHTESADGERYMVNPEPPALSINMQRWAAKFKQGQEH